MYRVEVLNAPIGSELDLQPWLLRSIDEVFDHCCGLGQLIVTKTEGGETYPSNLSVLVSHLCDPADVNSLSYEGLLRVGGRMRT